jgi:hypothetical protein
MDMKGGDVVVSVAIVREGHLSRVDEPRPENGQPEPENGQPAEVEASVSVEVVSQGEAN